MEPAKAFQADIASKLTVSDIKSSKLHEYAKGRGMLSMLRLQEPYYKAFEDKCANYLVEAVVITSKLAPNDPKTEKRIQDAILGIGGYQAWWQVRHNQIVDNRLRFSAVGLACVGSVAGAVIYLLRELGLVGATIPRHCRDDRSRGAVDYRNCW